MLTLTDTRRTRTCQTVSRRCFLRIGSLGLAGMTLPHFLAAKAQGAEYLRDRSVVLLFLQGGPAHIELFDPKMDAPVEFRSTTGEVQTRLPGVTFGGTFPQMAARADRLAVVRSYASGNAGHTYDSVTTARNPLEASLSSIYARVAGINNPETGMPNNTLLTAEAVQPDLKFRRNFETGALPTLTTPGRLGESYGAFNPSGASELKQNMELRIPAERFTDRRYLLQTLDRMRREADHNGLLEGVDRYRQQAFDVITRGVAEAFDLSQESPETLARYDTRPLFDMAVLNRYNDMYRASNLLGMQLLMARRLVEAGCGFVTVADAGWDMHGNNNSLPRLSGIVPLGSQVDHAVSAFLDDVQQRGLSDKILLVVTGEMGRTPRINSRGGRDHYGNMTSLVLAGGGVNTGTVIGQSDRNASNPLTTRFGPQHLMASIANSVFDLGVLRITNSVPTDVNRVLSEGTPIDGLF